MGVEQGFVYLHYRQQVKGEKRGVTFSSETERKKAKKRERFYRSLSCVFNVGDGKDDKRTGLEGRTRRGGGDSASRTERRRISKGFYRRQGGKTQTWRARISVLPVGRKGGSE